MNHHTWAIPNSKQPGDSSEDKKGKAPIAKKHTMHKAAKYEMDADRALEDLLKEYSAMDIDADPDADPKRKKKGIIGKIFG